MSSGWCTIESDPAVFTELVQRVGVKRVSVEEVVILEESELQKYDHVYGLVFLFKWSAAAKDAREGTAHPLGTIVKDAPVYFARQTIADACATVALVNTLCNHGDKIDLGDNMSNFLAFTQDLDAMTRGQQIGEFDPLRSAHNSFAPAQVFEMEPSGAESDVYHFVAFTFKNGSIWQLDGLQEGPVLVSAATPETYRAAMVAAVERAIADVTAKDTTGRGQGISFALMAIVDDPIVKLEERIAALTAEGKPVSTDLREELTTLKEVRESGRIENIRRRHNYIPTVVALLKALAEKGELEAIVEDVKAKQRAKKAEGDAASSS